MSDSRENGAAPQPTPAINTKVIGGATSAILALSLAVSSVRPWEGLEMRAYRDVVGVLTACWGHTGNDIRPGEVFTRGQCNTLLAQDVMAHANGLAACLRRPVPPQVFAAFTSFTFNAGVAGVCRSSALAAVNAGDYRRGCAGLSAWVYAGHPPRRIQGLVNRRAAERRLCEQGIAS